jgi:hypothetical protein
LNLARKAPSHQLVLVKKQSLFLLVFWFFLSLALFLWIRNHLKSETRGMAINEAQEHFKKDMAFRFWATSHDGVYFSEWQAFSAPDAAHVHSPGLSQMPRAPEI